MANFNHLNIIAEMNGYTLAKATAREKDEAKQRGETVRWVLHKGTHHNSFDTLEKVDFYFDSHGWINKDINSRHERRR
jgi:hypothetical protein